MAKRGSYAAKDLDAKVQILQEVERGQNSKTEIAKKYGIKKSTLSTYIKNKDAIFAAHEKENIEPSRKRLRTSAHPNVEDAVISWIKHVRSRNLPLSGPIIAAKARDFAMQMGIEDFSASEGWLTRLKARHGLTFKSVCGERATVDEATCEQWLSGKLRDLLASYSLDDVFNADETALYFKLLPNKTITYKDDSCAGGKRSKERITVMLCANATGTERCRLLVIGKASKPRCFKGIRTYPVDYRANSKAWMTAEIFSDWVRALDRKFASQGRKILLFVDNCTAHCEVQGLKAIRLAFLPKNTTAVLQPMDLGVIKNLKTLYRRHLLERILLCLDNDKSYSVDLLGAIHILAAVWNSVKSQTIANCFRKCGFAEPSATEGSGDPQLHSAEDENRLSSYDCAALPEGVTFQSYVSVDDGVETSGPLTDADIIDAVCSSRLEPEDCADLSDEDTDDTCQEPVPLPCASDVASALDTTARYFSGEENADAALELVQKLQAMLTESRFRKRVQLRITDYFQA